MSGRGSDWSVWKEPGHVSNDGSAKRRREEGNKNYQELDVNKEIRKRRRMGSGDVDSAVWLPSFQQSRDRDRGDDRDREEDVERQRGFQQRLPEINYPLAVSSFSASSSSQSSENDKNFFSMYTISGELRNKNPSKNKVTFIFNQLLPSREMVVSQRFQNDFDDWCASSNKAQRISYILFDAAKIAEKIENPIEVRYLTVEFVELLLNRLSNRRDLNAQSISIAFAGMKRLAERGLLREALPTGILEVLLQRLAGLMDCDAQAIGNTLHGLGKLAQSGLLHEALSTGSLEALLQILARLRACSAQAIGNSLHGLGKLAEGGLLRKALPTGILGGLLERLAGLKDCDAQAIGNALHGLGKLADSRLLSETLPAGILEALLQRLAGLRACSAQAIGNALHGLGKLAQRRLLPKALPTGILVGLLEKLAGLSDCKSQEIDSALHGLGKLAQGGLLSETLPARSLEALLQRLAGLSDCKSQNIGIVLHGLGKLAENGLLREALPRESLEALLQRLAGLSDCKSQNICNALYGLGKLIENKKLDKSTLQLNLIDSLISKAKDMFVDNKRLYSRQVLFCLRILEYNRLDVKLLCDYIKAAVVSPGLNCIEAIKAIRLLSNFPEEILQQTEAIELFQWLLIPLERLPFPEDSRLINRFHENIRNMILDIFSLLHDKNHGLAVQFKICFLTCPQNANHGLNQVQTLNVEHVSSEQTTAIESEGEPGDFNFSVREESMRSGDISQPGESQSSAAQLSQPNFSGAGYIAFHGSEHRFQQNIFECIIQGNLEGLKALLGYDKNVDRGRNVRKEASGSSVSFWRAPQRGAGQQSRQQEIAETFFRKIPYEALAYLFAQPNIDKYLFVLLDCCGKHTVYQLAREVSFGHFYHMPVDKLRKLIESMRHPLTIHRDSKALLNAISAIGLHPDYYRCPTLREIQIELLAEGIKYHGACKNHNVQLFLEEKRNKLDEITDNQDEENSIPADDFEDLEDLEDELLEENVVMDTGVTDIQARRLRAF